MADALNGFVHRLALVVAGHQDADCGLPGVVFLNFRAGDRPLRIIASVYLMTEISKQRIKMSQISAGGIGCPSPGNPIATFDPNWLKLTCFDFSRFVDSALIVA